MRVAYKIDDRKLSTCVNTWTEKSMPLTRRHELPHVHAFNHIPRSRNWQDFAFTSRWWQDVIRDQCATSRHVTQTRQALNRALNAGFTWARSATSTFQRHQPVSIGPVHSQPLLVAFNCGQYTLSLRRNDSFERRWLHCFYALHFLGFDFVSRQFFVEGIFYCSSQIQQGHLYFLLHCLSTKPL